MPTRNAPNEEAAWDARRAGRAYVRATVRRTKRAMLWLSIGLAMLGGHQGTQTQAFAAEAPDALSAATAHKESEAAGGRDAEALNAFETKPLLTVALLDTLINPLDAFTLRDTVASLERALPQYEWRTITLTTAEAYENIRAAQPDFIFASAGFSAEAQLERGVGSFRIATRKTSFARSASASVGAAFVVRKTDTRITDLASMQGMRAGASIPQAIDGWVAASGEIQARGFDPEKFFSEVDFSNNAYPNVLSSLLAKRIDVAILPACLLETAAQMRLVDASNLRVVNEKNEGLACRHSTALYPDVSIHALASAPEQAVRDVTVALLTLPKREADRIVIQTGEESAREETAIDFTNPDYEWVTNVSDITVQQLQRSLRIGPYAYLRDMSPSALFARYRTELTTAALLVLFLLLNEWRLHRIVRRRTADLREALAARMRTEKEAAQIRTRLAGLERRSIVQQMSGMIAHEINNPVGVVRNYAALLRLKLGIRTQPSADVSGAAPMPRMTTETPSEADRRLIASAVLAIDKEAVRISGIISRVRAYAKSTAQAHAPCDLRAVLAKSIAAYRAEADGRGTGACRIICSEKDAPVVILGNPLELEILFLNLIRNGARAAVAGMNAANRMSGTLEKHAPFVSISIEKTVLSGNRSHASETVGDAPASNTEKSKRSLSEDCKSSTEMGKPAWLVKVENSGEPLGESAFEALERLGDSVAVAPAGLGLGLTICRGIADSHAAELHFERRAAGGVAAFAVFAAEPQEALEETTNDAANAEDPAKRQ